MVFEMKTIAQCLQARLKGYEKAIAMVKCEIPWENGFNWPTTPYNDVTDQRNIDYWRGCAKELKNTLDMLEHCCK